MTDLSRRNFLKGLMATAGVAAVGLPAVTAITAYVAELPLVPLPFPAIPGDLFLKVDNVWRFAARLTTLSIERPTIMLCLGAYREVVDSLEPPRLNMRTYYDEEGQELLAKAFYDNSRQEIAIGMAPTQLVMAEGHFMEMEIEHWFDRSNLMQVDSTFRLSKSPEIVFQEETS